MSQTVMVDYMPTRKQAMFHASAADEVLYGGAAGGGKSKAVVMDAFMRCMKHPETHAYVFRRTYRELEDTIIAEALRSIPKSVGQYNVGRHEMRLINGSMIHFRHCASVADMYDYSGAEMHWLYFDELTTFEKEIYDFLKTRLRAKESLGIKPIVRSTSNPGGLGHGWVKHRFVDAGPYMSVVKFTEHSETLGRDFTHTRQYIPSKAKENPHITDDYIKQLELKPDALRRALLNGDWDAFESQVFIEFKNDKNHYDDRLWTHVIRPFEIPVTWPRYMSFDHGYSKPFSVGWWAVSPNGTAYRYREWYGWNGKDANTGIKISPKEIAKGIIAREEAERLDNLRVIRFADPSIFDCSRGPSVQEMMASEGVACVDGDNSRIPGKMMLHTKLAFDENGKPGLYVFSTCEQFIRTIPDLSYDPNKPEDVDTEAEDHCYDEVRYFLMSRFGPGRERKERQAAEYDPFIQHGR